MKPWLPAVLLAAVFPAMAQDVAGTLRVQGNVMVSTGGDFVTARDGQPIFAGQRILVGEGASATVEYGSDCEQRFDTAGVHAIPPGRCDDNDSDRNDEERSQQRDRPGEQGAEQPATGQGAATVSGAGTSTLTSLAAALGAVAATAAAMEEQGDSPPDHPISR